MPDYSEALQLELLGTPNDTTDTTFCGGYRVLLNGLMEKYPDESTRIVCFTPLKSNLHDVTVKYLGLYADAIKEICKDFPRVTVVDLYNAPEVDFTNSPLTYTYDKLHPNEKGYEVLTEYMVEQLVECGVIYINN